jgi:hypothetical protein
MGNDHGKVHVMSGGSFDYVCFKVEDSDILSSLDDVRKVEDYLRKIEKHDAADEVLMFIKEVETHQRRLRVIGSRIAPVLKAAEWVCSGDSGNDAIDNAYNYLMGLNKE